MTGANNNFKDNVVEDKLRITNKNDKVPHEPKIGYKHYSDEIYIPLEGETNEIPLPAGYCEGQEDKVSVLMFKMHLYLYMF